MRPDNRPPTSMRPIEISPHFSSYAEGSVMISIGQTRVLCNVTILDEIPRWMREQAVTGGWVTAEYAMLPRSTHTRSSRERHGPGGRTHEIQRLIGRSLRAGIDLELLGPRTCVVDCDVIEADGGTRTAAITGGYVALRLALAPLIANGQLPAEVISSHIAAISAGIINSRPCIDLCYAEDATAEVDMNVVMNADGKLIEIQGTGERATFSRGELNSLLELTESACKELIEIQHDAFKKAGLKN